MEAENGAKGTIQMREESFQFWLIDLLYKKKTNKMQRT